MHKEEILAIPLLFDIKSAIPYWQQFAAVIRAGSGKKWQDWGSILMWRITKERGVALHNF